MTPKTLTDELRSVLLFHALEAPEPNATVDRILADTVGPVVSLGSADEDPGARPARRRRLSARQLLVAAAVAVLLLSVAGINSVRNRDAGRTAAQPGRSQTDQPVSGRAAAGQLVLPPASDATGAGGKPTHYGTALDCSTIAGGRLVTGHFDDVTLATGERAYLYEFLCVGRDGQRSASQVQLFRQVGNQLKYLQTLPHPSADEHLNFMTGGVDSVSIQVSVTSAPPGGVAGEVRSMNWQLSDPDSSHILAATVAEPCTRKDLTATVTVVPYAAASSWLLQLRNHTGTACALEGFPQVRALRAGAAQSAAAPTLRGVAGGVTKTPAPPIVVLSPGADASAIIEQGAGSAASSCPPSDHLDVTLPNGVSLGLLPAELPGCGLVVHPLVGNALGSD